MECFEVKKILNAWADKELPPDISKRIEQHMIKCLTCSNDAVKLQKLINILDVMPSIPLPDRLFNRTVKAFRTSFVEINFLDWWHNLSFTMRFVTCLIALVGLAIGIFLDNSALTTPQDTSIMISYTQSLYQIKEVLP